MGNSTFSMKNSIMGSSVFRFKNQKHIKYLSTLLLFIFMGISIQVKAQSAGFNNTFAVLSINGGGNTYYDMNASTGNTDFNGANLGTFGSGNSLLLKGAEHNVYKCGGCDLTSTRLNYRIYTTGNTPGSYSNLVIGWASGFDNGCGGQDQQWANSTYSVDILSGLSAGNYTFELYSDATITCSTGTAYASNGGSNYKATFTVAKAESTISVTGSTSFTLNGLPQGPNTSTVSGSTGTVTYSYVGVSGTSYSASATPPTYPGSYTVTATVAADTNYNGASSSATTFTIRAGLYTYIPDTNFLNALIDPLTYNVTNIGSYVLTSNISGITELHIEGGVTKIADLTGIEAFTGLQDLYCADNALSSSLDLTMLPNLRYLDFQNNSIISLNISGLTKLETLIVWSNNLTALNLSTVPNLTYLDCDDNNFTSIDVSTLIHLNEFYCNGNQLTNLNVRGLTNLTNFECVGNYPSLTCILVDDVIAAYTTSTTIDPSQSPNTFWAKDSDPGTKYSYCDCSLTTTWNGSTWNHGAPTTGTYAAIISGNYNEAADISACTLTVNSGTVVIPSGYNVTLNSPMTVETGSSFTLSNNANLIQTTNVPNSGNITVKRNSAPIVRLDHTLWSSPVAAQNLFSFSPATLTNRFYNYNEGTNAYDNTALSVGSIFTPGVGFAIRAPNTWSSATPATLTYEGVFTGVPNTGTISFSALQAASGYNLVGNPYPSAIDAAAFVTANTNIGGTLYFYAHTLTMDSQGTFPTGTNYASWNSGSGGVAATLGTSGVPANTPNGIIEVGQGFFVKATTAGPVNFTNAMRVANTANQFFKTSATKKTATLERHRLWLDLTNDTGTEFNQILVAYAQGATMGVDRDYDGLAFGNTGSFLSSKIEGADYAIQGRALPFSTDDIVPLGFNAAIDGNFTISLSAMDGLFSGSQEVFLSDTATGATQDLKVAPYTFSATTGVDNTRFKLVYTNKTLGLSNNVFDKTGVTVFKKEGVFHINTNGIIMKDVFVFDIQGRLIYKQSKINSDTTTLSGLKAPNGVLLMKIVSDKNETVTIKAIN